MEGLWDAVKGWTGSRMMLNAFASGLFSLAMESLAMVRCSPIWAVTPAQIPGAGGGVGKGKESHQDAAWPWSDTGPTLLTGQS